MLESVEFKRLDGSFVGTVKGLPYHIEEGDPLFSVAAEMGADAPFEPAVEPIETSDEDHLAMMPPVSHVQMAESLAQWGIITRPEAEAWVIDGTTPAAMLSAIDSLPTEAARSLARMRSARPSTIKASDPITQALAKAHAQEGEEISFLLALFGFASEI